MALSYCLRVAEHLNRPETSDQGEKVQGSVCLYRLIRYGPWVHKVVNRGFLENHGRTFIVKSLLTD
jgi:hypothetical protein